MMICICFIFCSQFSSRTIASAVHNYTIKRVVIPDDYVKEVRPPHKKGSPVVIDFSVFVVDINSINVEDMDFRVDMFIHQRWVESRLTLTDDLFEEGDDYGKNNSLYMLFIISI